jgi:hypothetical protein
MKREAELPGADDPRVKKASGIGVLWDEWTNEWSLVRRFAKGGDPWIHGDIGEGSGSYGSSHYYQLEKDKFLTFLENSWKHPPTDADIQTAVNNSRK